MSKPIDLGRKFGDDIKPISISEMKDETHYPELFLPDVDDPRLANLPDKGECVIKYRVVSRTHREEKKGDKKDHSCSLRLEVTSITPPTSTEKKKDSDSGARKALSDYFKDAK